MMKHRTKRLLTVVCAVILAGCSHSSAASSPAPETQTAARVAGSLKYGDCEEARRRASLQPDLEVERIPAPVAMKPAPFQRVPESALRRDGSAEIKIDILIDTLGRADMKTFKVVKVSNKWFVENVRGVIGKWTFTPAVLAGCKVPRIYHFMSSVPPRASS